MAGAFLLCPMVLRAQDLAPRLSHHAASFQRRHADLVLYGGTLDFNWALPVTAAKGIPTFNCHHSFGLLRHSAKTLRRLHTARKRIVPCASLCGQAHQTAESAGSKKIEMDIVSSDRGTDAAKVSRLSPLTVTRPTMRF